MNYPKYIKTTSGEILIFSGILSHQEAAIAADIKNADQAGFVGLGRNGLARHGSSLTLSLSTNKDSGYDRYQNLHYAIKTFSSGSVMTLGVSSSLLYLERLKEKMSYDLIVSAQTHPLILSDDPDISLLMQALPILFNNLPETITEANMQASLINFFGV